MDKLLHLVGCFFIALNPYQTPDDAYKTSIAIGAAKEVGEVIR